MQRMVPSHEARRAAGSPNDRQLEAALFERARAGDLAAYDDLVRAFYASLLATATHLVGNREDAEDLVQDTFVDVHRGLERLRDTTAFEPWLRRILVHKIRDRFRRAGRGPAFATAIGLEALGDVEAGRDAHRRELTRLVQQALARLPERLRVTLSLRAIDGRSYDEIADATGVTAATCRTRAMKARRLLARWLEPWWRGDADAEDCR
ncbi:MAG: RNA polymerase sigma factor [Planctomycetota bacterium]